MEAQTVTRGETVVPSDGPGNRLPRHRALLSRIRRTRAVLVAVPVIVLSTLATTLGFGGPAAAAQRPERADRVRPDSGRPRNDRLLPRSADPAPTTYTVVAGDTISGIAARYGLPTARVLALNGLSWKSLIFPGQTLTLTGGDPGAAQAHAAQEDITHYTVVAGDTVSGIAGRYGLSTNTVLAANGLDHSSIIYPGQALAIPDGAPSQPLPAEPVADVTSAPPADGTVPPAQAAPVVQGDVVPLTDEMRANALLIVQIGRAESVPDAGIVIALAAAMQESGLRNVAYGDRDSLGLFQQRPSTGWGTPEQIMDPATSIRSFYGGADNPNRGLTKGLLDIAGWQTMSLNQAAQAVQLSSDPEAYGHWASSATAWLAELS